MIIVMSGKKQAGKNTACYHMFNKFQEKRDVLGIAPQWCEIKSSGIIDSDISMFNGLHVEENKPFLGEFFDKAQCKVYSFADALKQKICIEILNLDPADVYGDNKAKSKPTHIYWDSMPEEIQKEFRRADVKMERRQPMTVRQVLEVVGTRIFRSMYEHCWAQATYNLIESENYPLALITDGRFPNEVSMASENNGMTIRLTRDEFPDEIKTKPERALDGFPLGNYDFIIDNTGMTQEDKELELDRIFKNKVTKFK